MRDTDWKILFELSKNLNITRVAERCYKTQSAVTKRIQYMEAELETLILERTAHGISFTEEGKFLSEQAEKYLRLEEETKEGLLRLRQEKREVITIGSAYTYTKYSLNEVLRPFSEKHPNVSYRIVNKQSDVLHEMLLEGKLDVAFIRSDYCQGVNRMLLESTSAFCVSGAPLRLEELPGLERLDYQTNEKTRGLIREWWQERFDTAFPENTVDAGYIEFALRQLSMGKQYLLCFLPDNFANDYDLSLLPLLRKDGSCVQRNSWFIYSREKRRPGIVEELIDYVRKEVAVETAGEEYEI